MHSKLYCNKRAVGWLLVALLFMLNLTPQAQAFRDMPSVMTLPIGQSAAIYLPWPFIAGVDPLSPVASVGGQTLHDVKVASSQAETDVTLRLFGLIPIRRMRVNVVSERVLIPGGMSIGVALKTRGVLVVGSSDIEAENGAHVQPGREAGLRAGDYIEAINGETITDSKQFSRAVNTLSGEPVVLSVSRGGEKLTLTAQPRFDAIDGTYRLGLWVRDSTAGVGTLSFYDPATYVYGALGHAITDMDTGELLTVQDGEILKSEVVDIRQGQRGDPGELKGSFVNDQRVIGSLTINGNFGIYGVCDQPLTNALYPDGLPIATRAMIKTGPATLLCTLGDDGIRQYTCEITRLSPQDKPGQRGMVVKITDPKLLKRTGGIVQGMSGSPLIQNGRIIGAVTHVFVNDPTQGYGIFIEWMLAQADTAANPTGQYAQG